MRRFLFFFHFFHASAFFIILASVCCESVSMRSAAVSSRRRFLPHDAIAKCHRILPATILSFRPLCPFVMLVVRSKVAKCVLHLNISVSFAS